MSLTSRCFKAETSHQGYLQLKLIRGNQCDSPKDNRETEEKERMLALYTREWFSGLVIIWWKVDTVKSLWYHSSEILRSTCNPHPGLLQISSRNMRQRLISCRWQLLSHTLWW